MPAKDQPALVISRGGLGTGKTRMCANVTRLLLARGVEAQCVSVGWWFRAILAVARELARMDAGNLPDDALYRYAEKYTGEQLAAEAQAMRLSIDDGVARTRSGPLRPVSGDALNRMAGIWGGDHDVRHYIIQDISSRIEQAPESIFVIDSRSGNVDYGALRERVLNVYLTVDDEVGAGRKACTVEALRVRNWEDRHLPEGPLLDPGPDDRVLDTSRLAEDEVSAWLLDLILRLP